MASFSAWMRARSSPAGSSEGSRSVSSPLMARSSTLERSRPNREPSSSPSRSTVSTRERRLSRAATMRLCSGSGGTGRRILFILS